jgi:nucleotide-binding universal stress UspA family protein
VTRVSAAFGGSGQAGDLVVGAAGVAARVGASLRIVSFAVRARPPYTSGVGSGPERAVIAQWAEEIEASARAALEEVEQLPEVPERLEAIVGYGETWDDALEDVDWDEGDVLAVGSSSIGPVARVFLGSRASKIVRRSPVPVVVVPRGAAAELAEQAVQPAD